MFFLYAYFVTLFIAPQVWLPPFVGLPTDYILYPLWFCWALFTGRMGRLNFEAREYLYLGFIFWVGMSILVAGTTWAFVDVVVLRYFKWFILYLLIRATVTDVAALRKAAAFMTLLIYVLVVEGIDHKLSPDGVNWAGQSLGWVDPAVLAAGGSGRTKWVGVFDGIGVFCVAYTLSLPFVLQYASGNFSKLTKWINRLGLLFLLLAIYYTSSRGGFLATLALVALHLALKYKVSLKAIVIASSVVVAAYTLAPPHLTSTKDSSNSAQNRIDVWAAGLSMVSSNPIFGVGRFNFINYTKTIIAHNSGVELLAETGVVGLFLWMSTILACLRSAYSRLLHTEHPADRDTVVALMLCVLGYLISSLFVTLEYETFYMLLGLCAGLRDARMPRVYGKPEAKKVALAVVVYALVIKAVVMMY